MSTTSGRWLRQLGDTREPRTRLVCFPHAGGSAHSYASWAPLIQPDAQLLAVQYPGRADRFDEPPAESLTEMASHAAAELSELAPLPLDLFGHSLGALVCYETALRLRAMGRHVRCLMVSGSNPPRYAGGGTAHLAGDDELWASLCGLGGIAPEVADNEEIASIWLPVLRADIAAEETYRPRPDAAPLSCPVRCHYGTDDRLVDASLLPAWAEVTSASFMLRGHPGGHFQVYADPLGVLYGGAHGDAGRARASLR